MIVCRTFVESIQRIKHEKGDYDRIGLGGTLYGPQNFIDLQVNPIGSKISTGDEVVITIGEPICQD